MSTRALRSLAFLCWLLLGCAPPPSPALVAAPPAPSAAPADRGAPPAPAGAAPAAAAAEGDGSAARARGIGQGTKGGEDDEGGVERAPLQGAAQNAPQQGPAERAPQQGAARAPLLGVPGGVDPGPVPVDAADPQWGSRDAPVTLVEFADFECPFCSKVSQTLASLKNSYGPSTLRIVWKNNPLPFHKEARPAAEVALALFVRGGNDAFWRAHDGLFAGQRDLRLASSQQMKREGLGDIELGVMIAAGQIGAKIDADMELGKKAGVQGTPAFFINGIFLSGAQPVEKFSEIIDDQVKKARAEIAGGTPPSLVYAKMSRAQKTSVAPPSSTPAPDDKTVWQVPLGNAPVRGKATALVTMVQFADYQCPFCARAEATLTQLQAFYGDKLRLVFRNNPLPFHPRAEPTAELALEARAQKGDAAFWKIHDALFADQTHLDDASLMALAAGAGLDVARAMKAVADHKHQAILDEEQSLADDLQASGTPHFFINGRRLVGAQAIEKFKAMIDEEITKAEAMIKGGVPASRLYASILASGKAPPPMEKKAGVPAPTKASPSRGPANAKVVVQLFADFQCPFCKRVVPTIAELEKAFPGQIRVVWRNLPLPMHKDAMPAAEAAMEAFHQKGAAGFWAMHDLLYAAQGQPDALARPALDGYAAQLGLDTVEFAAALDGEAHKAEIEADQGIASRAGISGTPACLVNDYYVSGAQPLSRFSKVVKRILAGK
jgi:protein-disulfide isomerase